MKILMAHWTLHWTGAQVVMVTLSKHLRAQGHGVDFVTTLRPGSESSQFEPYCNSLWHFGRALYESPRTYLTRFRKAVEAREYDLLVTHHSIEAVAVAGLLPTKTATVSVIHDCPKTGDGHVGLLNRNAFDAYIGVSKGVTESVASIVGEGARLICILNGVPPGNCPERTPSPTLRAIFVGRLAENQKGILLLPEIVLEAKRRGIPIELTVIGDGEDRSKLVAEIERLSLNDCINLTGKIPQTEVFKHMERADVAISCSRHEGLPLVLIEAMARGCVPVVTNLKASSAEVVTDGEDGFLIDGREPASFVDALERLWGEPALMPAMRRGAHLTATTRFSERRMCEEYEAVFNELRSLPQGRRRIQSCPSFTGGV